MAETSENTTTWTDLAIGLYDRLTGRGAEITYEFNNMEVAYQAVCPMKHPTRTGK